MKYKLNYDDTKWFAWYPVKVEGYYVWLEYIIRYKSFIGRHYGSYSYKFLKD